jgi:LPS export ABC transporter protein LptC
MKISFSVWNILCVLFLVSCGNNINKVNTLTDKSMMDTEQADSVTIFYSNNGFTKAKLSSKKFKHILTAKPPYIEMSEGVQVTFYNEQHLISSTLTAKRGRYYEANQNVLVRDSVRIINIKNEELQTEELIWNEQLQQFFTEKAVVIKTPTQILYGTGMEANQDFSSYTILHPKGIIQITDKAMIPK